MSSSILDGKVLAAKLKEDLTDEVASLKNKYSQAPRIISIAFGQSGASQSYISSQQKTAQSLGIHYSLQILDEHITTQDAVDFIQRVNHDKEVHGVIINKPTPPSVDFYTLINAIAPHKDIEGMNLVNLGRLWMDKSKLWPCTPAAALALLKSSGLSLSGKSAVIIGRSEIVGKPMALLLLKEDMTVTICHSKTTDLKTQVNRADVVIAAVGKPSMVKEDWIKEGAIVIDVGINQLDGKIVGDVDFESCKNKASAMTPVPGGVGPVTAVILMKNTVEAFKQQVGNADLRSVQGKL